MTRRSQRIGYREARAHAVIVAIVGSLFIVAVVVLGRSDRSVFGPLKWTDFVHFYTLGHIASAGDSALLYDGPAQYARQTALVPASKGNVFIPVYAPQTALLFAPLSGLPYYRAGLVWALVTMGTYAWAIWLAWRPARGVMSDRVFLVAAALAFPPVLQLPTQGQTTAFALLAFAGGWRSMEAGRPVLAGLALSLLAVKPQFGLVLTAIAILFRQWRLVAGGLLGLALQVVAVLTVFDSAVLTTYLGVIRRLSELTPLLEPQPHKMHSLAAVTGLLPGAWGTAAWGMTSLAIVSATAWAWRQSGEWRVRFGVLVLASALVNPHLTIYDVTVVALPIVWIGGWLLARPDDSAWFWQRVYWISVVLFIPTAVYVKVQLSPLLMSALLWQTVRRLRADTRARTEREPQFTVG